MSSIIQMNCYLESEYFSSLLLETPPLYPYQELSEILTAPLNRIWNIFTNHCDSSSTKIAEDLRIQQKLKRQMQHGLNQMEKEPFKPFEYRPAIQGWVGQQECIGSYQVGIAQNIGGRKEMQDEHLAISSTVSIGGQVYPFQLFAIFDGHGGKVAACFVRDHLVQTLKVALMEFNDGYLSDTGIWKALKITPVRLSQSFKEYCIFHNNEELANKCGTTLTASLILDQKLWSFNVGDSRIVLDNNGIFIQLTEDAKPGDIRYKKSIEKRGGIVQTNGRTPRACGISLARSIGDHVSKGVISSRSKITVKPLSEIQPDSHLMLCCDGVWDVARSKDIAMTVYTYKDPLLALSDLARNIIYSAYKSGSGDNLSCMVIKLDRP